MTAIACHICLANMHAVSHTGAGVCKYIDIYTYYIYAYCAYELQN